MKKLLILSGKGGTGKTTTAASFIDFSKTKAASDCDVDAPNLHLVFQQNSNPTVSDFFGGNKAKIHEEKCISCGTCQKYCRFNAIEKIESNIETQAEKKSIIKYQINEYSCEGCTTCQFVCPEKAITMEKDIAGQKELFLSDKVFSTATLKMGRGNSGKLVSEVKSEMNKNAKEAKIETPLAIIDGSPGIGCPVIASASGVDLILVVAEPSASGISDLKRLVKTAKSFQTGLAVCVNKWDISPESTKEIENFCKEKNISFVGKIPFDKNASKAINSGKTLAQIECPAKDALKNIYENTLQLLKL